MALEPITRQEKIIAGQDLTPITRLEMFLKQFGGGGGGSVPKPLTYDYMPEGYPKKTLGTATLMEEQELEFTLIEEAGFYIAPATNAFEIAEGQTYTVSWDGTEYECVGAAFSGGRYLLGNLSIQGVGADTGEPFLYVYDRSTASGTFATLDTSASHTISVKRVEETVTPMAEEFLPAIADFVINGTVNSNMEVTLDKTFAQIQAAIQEGKHPAVDIAGMGDTFLPLVFADTDVVAFAAVADVSEGTITNIGITITADEAILFNRSASPTLNSDGTLNQFPMEADPISPMQIATKHYVDNKECILKSTTPGSTKKFKITVDDSGAITATEVT